MVMTDSGGLQKEAFFFKKICITLRDETEWIELIKNGYNVVTGVDTEKIVKAFLTLKNKKKDFNNNFYGNGNAGDIIISNL